MTANPPPPPRFAWDWARGWLTVFLANLPMPVLYGMSSTGRDVWLGLIGGLAVVFWAGLVLSGFRFRVGRSLVWGGGVVALCQVFEVFHVGSVLLAREAWELVRGVRDEPLAEQNLEVFFIVIVSAQPLAFLAVLSGSVIRWYRGDRPIWSNPPADSDADAS